MAHPHTELAFKALQRKIERLENSLDEANARISTLLTQEHMCAYCMEPAEYNEPEIIDAEIIE